MCQKHAEPTTVALFALDLIAGSNYIMLTVLTLCVSVSDSVS